MLCDRGSTRSMLAGPCRAHLRAPGLPVVPPQPHPMYPVHARAQHQQAAVSCGGSGCASSRNGGVLPQPNFGPLSGQRRQWWLLSQRGPQPPACAWQQQDPARVRPAWSEADEDKERSRMYRRTVFDFARWREHRSTARYRRHIVSIWGSRIVRGLAGPLWFVALLSVAVGCYESARENGMLPPGFTTISLEQQDPFQLSSFALSLLLVFRTNSSYARWLDGRKIWGGVVNRSRDLVRQAGAWFPEAEADLLAIVERWTVAYSHALQAHLREDGDFRAVLQDILLPKELDAVMLAQHRPNFIMSVLSTAIEEAHVPDSARVRMDENVTSFADALGGCERILKTPIPLTWTRHTSRFLVMWLVFMPFTLWHACRWATPAASVAIAFLLLGIEEIGVQIEEPFAILPLEAMCATIKRDCREIHGRRHDIRSLVTSCVRPMYKEGSGPADLRPKHERQTSQRQATALSSERVDMIDVVDGMDVGR